MPPTFDYPPPGLPNRSNWHFAHLGLAFFLSLLVNSFVFPCLCADGDSKAYFIYAFTLLVLCRMLIAYARREQSRTWLFYTLLCYTSPFWMAALFFTIEHINHLAQLRDLHRYALPGIPPH